jgi:hypothetical protein
MSTILPTSKKMLTGQYKVLKYHFDRDGASLSTGVEKPRDPRNIPVFSVAGSVTGTS